MTMTNEKLTAEIKKLVKQVMDLEAEVEGLSNEVFGPIKPIEPPVPLPPVKPPVPPPPSDGDIINIDMSRAYHIDTRMKAGETKVFSFEFAGGIPGSNSYTQFTAVQLYSTDGCLKMSIPEYNYGNEKCRYEQSNGVGTDRTYTRWVVPTNKEILLYITNEGGKTTLRLKSNGENIY